MGSSYGIDNESGEAVINSGCISAYEEAVENSRFGTLIINGGAITGLLGPGLGAGINNYGTLIMNGGSISSNSNDPSVFIPSVYNGGTMTIYGGNLSSITDEAGGLTMIYGTFSQYGAITSSEGVITGTLADGTNATISYSNISYDGYSGVILLEPVPEPSCLAALALGLGGIAVRRRRRA